MEESDAVGSGGRRRNGLPDDHYNVYVVTYDMGFIRDALVSTWGEPNVSGLLNGPSSIELHVSCSGMDRTPSWKVFHPHFAGRSWTREGQIAWGTNQRSAVAPRGYRPATLEETCWFALTHSRFGASFVGLGSFLVPDDDGRHYAPVVWINWNSNVCTHALDAIGVDGEVIGCSFTLFVVCE